MRTIAIIPARMGSSRFPGKPLALLLGRPMIEQVSIAAKQCDAVDAVYVATCDDEIRNAVRDFGGNAIMTSPDHQRASDRVAEAADLIDAAEGRASDIVVMLQGDEPMITPEMIKAAVAPMFDEPNMLCVNLVRRIFTREERDDPNTIKVVMNNQREAMYFSRAPIPNIAYAESIAALKQVCVIPFRRSFLREFSQLEPTPLERSESIDMLRALEHGRKVHLVETEVDTHAVDTIEDLKLVEDLMRDARSKQ
jgi:3-deoxy-manno-octulosonate cytidylyltransferase (CMP-KDO synthetase)